MREILFRGKRKDNSEWIEGSLFQWGNDAYILRDLAMNVKYEVIPETVGQYIGMGDKNGIKIFEGDILNYNPSFSVIETYVIEFDSASFCHREIDCKFPAAFTDCESGLGSGNYLEIIGNIHDNPELMR